MYVAQKLNRAAVADADEKRTNRFFADASLRSAERATLVDYKGSGWSRGHMAPAGDMPTAQAMAQSFSLANMAPQAAKHNGGAWAHSVESATRKYAARASGDVYVITGPVFVPSIKQSPGIGPGQVRVPKYLFKLVYGQDKNRAWAHWHLNDDATHVAKPISYADGNTQTKVIVVNHSLAPAGGEGCLSVSTTTAFTPLKTPHVKSRRKLHAYLNLKLD